RDEVPGGRDVRGLALVGLRLELLQVVFGDRGRRLILRLRGQAFERVPGGALRLAALLPLLERVALVRVGVGPGAERAARDVPADRAAGAHGHGLQVLRLARLPGHGHHVLVALLAVPAHAQLLDRHWRRAPNEAKTAA